MTFHNCGICNRFTDSERPCHYCGAVFIACVRRHYHVDSGRQMVRGIRRVLPCAEKIGVASRAVVQQVTARLVKGA